MERDDDLGSEFDVIVLGTGLTECIFAAAAARVGKTVLHMDRNDYYGGDWATFNFEGIKKWLFVHTSESANDEAVSDESVYSTHLKEGEMAYVTRSFTNIRHVSEHSFISHQPLKEELVDKPATTSESDVSSELNDDCSRSVADEIEKGMGEASIAEKGEASCSSKLINPSPKIWFKEDFDRLGRKFNLDLAPKLLFSSGFLVDLLVSSNIGRYAEFKPVSRVLTYLNGKLEQVPCSRADIFSTKHVTIVEKRMLMKFLSSCMEYSQSPEEYKDYVDKSFYEFLKSRKMTPNVVHYILYSIAMVDETASTLEGLEATQQFMKSLGRYGNTPFLWPMYGSGELPQCFCRCCAVFGGVYYLKRKAEAVILSPEKKCVGIVSDNKRINCKHLVAEASYMVPLYWAGSSEISKKNVSRAMVVTNRSLLKSEKEQLTFLRLPPCGENQLTVTAIELGPSAGACPSDLFIVHLSCKSVDTAEQDLKSAVNILFQNQNQTADDTRPNILWMVYFNVGAVERDEIKNICGFDVNLTSTTNSDIDYDHAAVEAKKLFGQIFPEDEFLPRAPDPEEIKIGDDADQPAESEQRAEETSQGIKVGDNEECVVAAPESRETLQEAEKMP